MAHQALYREWRPKIFDEVVEQKHAVYALRQAVVSGQIAHAYLFSGTRGTGKTTLAKIFARAINCLNPDAGNPCNQCAICRGMLDGSLLDIVEMDAASNNSVDNIRRICDEIVFMPSQARYKVYIIDEVHMLSTGAFNALLKTLEEPPAHAVFILATTEPHRIPATILSRCQRYEFRRLSVDSMVSRLDEIAKADAIDVSPEALLTIAGLADGALRDAISLLDQARASFPGRIERDDVLALAGIVQDEFMQQTATALLHGDAAVLLGLIDQLVMAGRDLARFVTDMAQYLRNVLICQVTADPKLLVRASSEALLGMRQLAAESSSEKLLEMIRGLSALLSDLRWAADSRTALEIGLIRLMPEPVAAKAAGPGKPAKQATPDRIEEPQPDAPPTLPLEAAPVVSEEMAHPDPPMDEEPAGQPADPPMRESGDVVAFWQQILDQLLAEGQMTLYLFSRAARPVLDGNTLRLLFDVSDQINCRETAQAASLKILSRHASKLVGRNIEVSASLISDAPDDADVCGKHEENWIDKVKQTADSLGIPLKMEE